MIELGNVSDGLSTHTFEHELPANKNVYLCYEVVPTLIMASANSTNMQTQAAALPPNGTTLVVFTLDNVRVEALTVKEQSYDDRGRITENSNGAYEYSNAAKPYQNTAVTLKPSQNSYYEANSPLTITYNAFKSPIEIVHPTADRISFGYNYMQQRSVMYYGNTNANKLSRPYRRYYSADGTMEITYTTANGAIEFMTYIGGDPYTAPIVYQVKYRGDIALPKPTKEIFYLHRDYQGSILAVSNSAGVLVEKRLFDAWGEVLQVKDGNNNSLPKLTFFDRGYTGHEHLQSVGLIHMNGRLYDAKLHRFLQPDNYVQDPYNTQNYNRYGYVLNNPLKYTDPNGEIIDPVSLSILIGVAISVGVYGIMVATGHAELSFEGAFTAVLMGAISGGVTCGIGEWATTIGNFYARAGAQALMHGTFQGGMTAVQGGKFWTGFASGALSSLVSSAWQGGNTIETKFQANGDYTSGHFFKEITKHQGVSGALGIGNRAISTMLLGTITGGAGAALAKGNFWQGAVTGLIVSGLNHVAHSAFDGDGDPPVKTEKSYRPPTKTDALFATVGGYNDFLHNHKTYFTTKGVEKPIYNALGVARSARALNFATISNTVKFAGNVGGVISTAASYNSIFSGDAKTIDYVDAGVGTTGLTATAVTYFSGVEIPVIGQAVGFYGLLRFSYDLGYHYGPSKWYGNDDKSWFK